MGLWFSINRQWFLWSKHSRQPWCRNVGITSVSPNLLQPYHLFWRRPEIIQLKFFLSSYLTATCKCLMDQTTGKRIAPQQMRSIRTKTSFHTWWSTKDSWMMWERHENHTCFSLFWFFQYDVSDIGYHL